MTTLYLRDDLITVVGEIPQYPAPTLYPSASLYPGDQPALSDAVFYGPGGVPYSIKDKLTAGGGSSFTETIPAFTAQALEMIDETGQPILHT